MLAPRQVWVLYIYCIGWKHFVFNKSSIVRCLAKTCIVSCVYALVTAGSIFFRIKDPQWCALQKTKKLKCSYVLFWIKDPQWCARQKKKKKSAGVLTSSGDLHNVVVQDETSFPGSRPVGVKGGGPLAPCYTKGLGDRSGATVQLPIWVELQVIRPAPALEVDVVNVVLDCHLHSLRPVTGQMDGVGAVVVVVVFARVAGTGEISGVSI